MKKQPNVLFMIADDHRFDAIKALGNEEVQTPNLDALAKEGIAFSQTHIMGGFSGAVCMPGRASVHSGANVFRSGGDFEIQQDLALLSETFQEKGYETYAVGKWHNDLTSFHRSFQDGDKLFFRGMSDHFEVPYHTYHPEGKYSKEDLQIGEQHSSELFTDAAIDYLKNAEKDHPFFLYVAYTAPHDPRTAPKEYHDLYDPKEIEIPPNFMPKHPFDNGELHVRDEYLADFPRTKEDIQQHIANYYAMITHLDAQIGRLLQTLEDIGEKENTIIVYTADHGLSIGQHGLMGKQNLYDHSIRIPLLICGPELPKNQRIDALTYQIDIFPTLCAMAEIPIPKTVDGKNLLPLIHGEKEKVYDYLYSVYRNYQRMVKNKEWKLIRYYRENGQGTDLVQLFNIHEDPYETMNVCELPENEAIIKRLAQQLSHWQKEVEDPLQDIPVL